MAALIPPNITDIGLVHQRFDVDKGQSPFIEFLQNHWKYSFSHYNITIQAFDPFAAFPSGITLNLVHHRFRFDFGFFLGLDVGTARVFPLPTDIGGFPIPSTSPLTTSSSSSLNSSLIPRSASVFEACSS